MDTLFLQSLDKLGIVAILLLVLYFGVRVASRMLDRGIAWGKSISDAHLECTKENTKVLTQLVSEVGQVRDSVNAFHQRYDFMLSCNAVKCPIKPGKFNQSDQPDQ